MPKRLVAASRGKVELQEYDEDPLNHDEVRIKTLYSLISHGTELSTLVGRTARFNKPWSAEFRVYTEDNRDKKTFPTQLGYSCVGKVSEIASRGSRLQLGDIVWLDRPHASEHIVLEAEATCGLCKPGIDMRRYTFRVLAKVALAAVHDAHPYLGGNAAVIGLGAVGQLVTESLSIAGVAEIFGVEPNAFRRNFAANRGIFSVDPLPDAAIIIKEMTKNCGVDVAIETSGTYQGLATAIRAVRVGGRVITASTYVGCANCLNLGEEYHRNRVDLISSMSVNDCPHRGEPLWNHERLMTATRDMLDRGALKPEDLITQTIQLDDAPAFYARSLEEHPSYISTLISYGEEAA